MNEGLSKKKIIELVDVFNNQRIPLSAKERENLSKIYPYYGAQSIVDYVDKYIFDGEYILVAEDGENLRSNNQNICNLANGKFWVNNHAHILRANSENITKYIYYNFNLINFEPYITGSAQPKLNKENLLNIETYVHDKKEQEKIVSVLSALDSKIELNNRINAELEAMAKTIYDYWFVQFDFPDKHGKPYKSSGGKMAWNEVLKREIPEGWEVNTIGAILSELTKGFTTEYVETSNLINLNQKVNKGFSLERQYYKYLDEGIEIPAQKYAREKDILINSLGQGTIGRVHFFCEKAKNIVVDQHLFILRVNEKKVTATYLYLLLTSKAYQIQIDRQITGSTGMQMLNASNLKDINIIIPKLDVMQQFEKSVYPFFEMVVVNEIENQQLASLRDWLLPMLMNGQVKVV